jgi:hypothetical protein
MTQLTSAISEVDRRFEELKSEFVNGWQSSCKDLRDYIQPTRGNFDEDTESRGEMINHQKVLDGYASLASEILASGLLSGMTSPSRPWFKLALDDDLFNNDPTVRVWLDDTEKRIRSVLNQSNIYQVLFGAYKEIGAFGTACFIVLEDFEDVVRGYSFTSGEYYLGIDNRGRVNAFGREYWMTVDQMVIEFGLESCSPQVQSEYKNNARGTYHKVKHLIEKADYKVDGLPTNGMEYRSVYWEGTSKNTDFLAKRGFNKFAVIAPRWETVTTHQVYGKGPGWNALGDIKQLQKTADDKLKLQEKLHNPPVTANEDIEGFINLVPGGISRTSANLPDGGVRPAYTVPDALQSFIEMENHLKENIDKFFFVNLFLMILNMDRTNMTATEVAERQQEKIMMMGSILHRLQEELLDPLIDLVFGIMLDNGLIAQPPQQIQGMELKVKYISILAQAQEAVGVNSIKRVMESAIGISQVRPDILDNFDFDEVARQLNEGEGAPAKLILDPQVVAEQRQYKQQVQAMQQMAQIGKDGGSGIKNIAEANKTANEAQQTQ